jgi:NMD protein affecting ribosome stability and mRNA decay
MAMRTNKRYSNVTFTKRVDREAGRHRTARSRREPLLCQECGSWFIRRRWVRPIDAVRHARKVRLLPAGTAVCPACFRQREGLPEGFVYIEGSFASRHRAEIERLIFNETQRARRRNPLARVISWGKDNKGTPYFSTTTLYLARRLGRALADALGGTLQYKFSHENKLLRVHWQKD